MPPGSAERRQELAGLFTAFLRLGCTSFGGPVAHIAFFRAEFVERRRWLSERAYGDLVALCQFLPGPASSQVGMATGALRGGLPGAAVAWLAFTLPSALIMLALGLGLATAAAVDLEAGWVQGLKAAVAAVVAHAVWGMARSLCPRARHLAIAAAAAVVVLALGGVAGQLTAIAGGALVGLGLLPAGTAEGGGSLRVPLGRRPAAVMVALAFGLLALLPLAALVAAPDGTVALIDAVYRAGALVFGGGHVVLPLLQSHIVEPGWVDPSAFMAGYGLAQALPGPLFTFAAYLGASATAGPGGVAGGLAAIAAIFLPGALLVLGLLPFWERIRSSPTLRPAVTGTNAAVVGLLAAALYDPVIVTGVTGLGEGAVALAALVALASGRVSSWAVVAAAAAAGALFLGGGA